MRVRRVLLVGSCALAVAAAAWGGSNPVAVSPGSPANVTLVESHCPTFSWGEVQGAQSYELIVYRIGERGEVSAPVLRQTIAAAALGWTPPLNRCLERGGRYAWTVRARGKQGMGLWSEALLFETAGTPSETEVRQALAVLRRYRETARRQQVAPSEDDIVSREAERPVGGSQMREGVAEQWLTGNTAGAEPSPQVVTPPASVSLGIDGDFDLGGFVFKNGVPFIHNDGTRNTALGLNALTANTTGNDNTATGAGALGNNTTGLRNTATGAGALGNNTGGHNTATGAGALFYNTTGRNNTATGVWALFSNTTGRDNTAFGEGALFDNTTGSGNTAIGGNALSGNTTGYSNTAIGRGVLYSNTTGFNNIAIGIGALGYNTTGHGNAAFGSEALFNNTTGHSNTAVGAGAGYYLGYQVETPTTSMSWNVFIASRGETDEAHVIRIGRAYNEGYGGGGWGQNRTFIAGIDDQTLTVSANPVCVEPTGQLGKCPAPSSRRYKHDIQDIGPGSERLLELWPVTFRFKEEIAGQEKALQFGLIAEEVAEVYPELVSFDKKGRPEAVKYRFLSSLLLFELRKQATEIQGMRARLERLEIPEPTYRRTGLRGSP